MPRKKNIRPYHKPRQRKSLHAAQDRKIVSFRVHSSLLNRLDLLARRFATTRTEVIETVLLRYLSERGDDVEAMLAQIGADDDRQLDIFQ